MRESLYAGSNAAMSGMLESEYAFAERARTSVRAAFLEYLAEDSLVLQPGPTPGRPLYGGAKESRDRLEWYPSIADVAASGDMGFTSGPWVYTADGSDAPIHGHFLTVWKCDSHGAWRVQFDGGVSHAAPAVAEAPLTPDHANAQEKDVPEYHLISQDAVSHAVSDFQVVVRDNGVAAGLRTFARNDDFKFCVEGDAPMTLDAANVYLDKHSIDVGSWREAARGRSADSTIAYSVGEFTGAKGHARNAYAQIWQYDPKVANWGVRFLLVSPTADAKKNS